MELEDEFPFGKHKGQQVKDVIEGDPEYIRWLIMNKDVFFDDEVLEKLALRNIKR